MIEKNMNEFNKENKRENGYKGALQLGKGLKKVSKSKNTN